MPDGSAVRRVTSLRGLAVFRDFNWTSDVPELRQLNLIYGFNGSGKTTLSRVFASLSQGALHPKLPADGSFHIEFSDGRRIKSSDDFDAMADRLLVFNKDFVEKNIRWKEGTANPVFYLGTDQAESAKELAEVEAALEKLQPRVLSVSSDADQKGKTFTQFKTDLARLIGERIGKARSYNASRLDADYQGGPYETDLELSDTQIAQYVGVLAQDSPLAKCDPLDGTPLDLEDLVREAHRVLKQSLGTMVLDELRSHAVMLKWVKEGLDYHRAHDLDSCLFCGNEVTEDRFGALDAVIDERYDRLVREVSEVRTGAEATRGHLQTLLTAIPGQNDVTKNVQGRLGLAARKLEEALSAAQATVSAVLDALAHKETAPNVAAEAGEVGTPVDAASQATAIDEALSAVNEVIDDHNSAHDEFEAVRERARKWLKDHYLADGQARYEELRTELAEAESLQATLREEQDELRRKAEHLRAAMRKHGPAADRINNMVRNYLGHGELEIATLEDGYELRRQGKPVPELLSEGEKTAIALCYFVSLLGSEGRRLRDLIVVIDDPISSLDTRALNYAFNLIRSAMGSAGQLIVLTHNLHFMNETKKWLKPRTEKAAGAEKAKATLLMLDLVQTAGEGGRSATIRELPRYIRDYESEYHYLFHLVLRFAEAPDDDFGYFYLMPNALRKVLEIFLAFKLPGPDRLSSKINSIAESEELLDSSRLRALDRLVQLESHADSLDDLVTFSAMTVEETRDATTALFHLMEVVDRKHHDRLRRICRP